MEEAAVFVAEQALHPVKLDGKPDPLDVI